MQPDKEEARQKCQEACVNEQGAPGQNQRQKESLQRVEARTGCLGECKEIVQAAKGRVRKTKALRELN